MSTPVITPAEEYSNPFSDPPAQVSPKYTPGSGSIVTSAEGGSTPTNKADGTKGKKRVGFRGGDETGDSASRRASFIDASVDGASPPFSGPVSPGISGETSPYSTTPHSRKSSKDLLLPPLPASATSHLPELSQQQTEQIHKAFNVNNLQLPRPRPAIRLNAASTVKGDDIDVELMEGPDEDGQRAVRQKRALEAFERGKRLEQDQRSTSEPNSRRGSMKVKKPPAPMRTGDIPLQDLHDISDASDAEHDMLQPHKLKPRSVHQEAYGLVRRHTDARGLRSNSEAESSSGTRSGHVTPTEEIEFFEDYQPRPKQYRGGILGSLLKLYGDQQPGGGMGTTPPGIPKAHVRGDYSTASTPQHSPSESGASTPNGRHWYSPYRHHKNSQSSSSLAQLVGSSASFGSPAVTGLGEQVSQRLKEQQEANKRPGMGKRTRSGGAIAAINRLSRAKFDEEIRITKHIGETIARQKYLAKICRALMQYGAPTHRLEEYMRMSARVLETDAQFLYIPGAMIMSFEDRDTHTSEVKLVKVAQGLDLGKLRDVHEVYKEVVSFLARKTITMVSIFNILT